MWVQKSTLLKKALNGMHLYSDKMEYLIKLMIWVVSWIGGIHVLRGKTDGVSSAYFIFSLSLLMEFAQKIKGKRDRFSIVVHTLFCFAIVAMLLLSVFLLLDNSYNSGIHCIMHIISIVILCFMAIDCSILWFSKDPDDDSPSVSNQKPDTSAEEVTAFTQRLMKGNLGDIGEVN